MNYMDETVGMSADDGSAVQERIFMPLCDRTVVHEVSEEITLSEEQPEIRRILSVSWKAMPPARYLGGGNAEWNGNTEYQMLYLAGDGSLQTATFTAEYEFRTPLETGEGEFDLNEGVCTFVRTDSEQLNTRVTAPRKISLRQRLRSRVRVFGRMILGETRTGEAGDVSFLRLTRDGVRLRPTLSRSEGLTIQDECSLPSPECRVVWADSRVWISEIHAQEGGLQVRGSVLLCFLLDRNGEAESLNRKIPFEGVLEGEEITSEDTASVSGVLSELNVTAEEGRLFCEGELLLTGRSMRSEAFRYTEDLYSTEREVLCEEALYEIPTALKCESRHLSQSERVSLSEISYPEGAQVCHAFGEVHLETCETLADKYVWSGESRYKILCRKEGEYSVLELSFPFRYETESAGAEVRCADGAAEVSECRVRTDGETLYLDAEISICADYAGSETIRTVKSVRVGAPTERAENCMTVYYPVPGDSVWTVAKKYRISPDDLQGDLSTYFVF